MKWTENLHNKALGLAREYRRVEAELLEVMQKIDEAKIYRRMGYSSLFDYAVSGLGFTESVAYTFITVARKAKTVPALQSAIVSNTLSVSQARRVVPILTNENASEFIVKAATLTQREIEKEVACLQPERAVIEQSKYVTPTRLALQIGASEGLIQKLKRAQDLESQKRRSGVSLETTIEAAIDLYLERLDPIRKAERNAKLEREQKKENINTKNRKQPVLGDGKSRPPKASASPLSDAKPALRQAIPAKTKHQLHLRDGGRCTQIDPRGKRCSEARWTQIHHRQPKELGGSDDLENLTTLCFHHHWAIHEEITGMERST